MLFVSILAMQYETPSSLPYDPFYANAISVSSGDTLTLDRVGFAKNVKVQIWGIDAPDEGQPYFAEAKAALARLTKDRLHVKPITVDACGVLRVQLSQNETTDHTFYIDQLLVAGGYAWWNPLEDHNNVFLSQRQKHAKEKGIGLFKQLNASPPWVWRYRQIAEKRSGN